MGSVAFALPVSDEQSTSSPFHPDHLLLRHHRECVDQLHLHLVWQLQNFDQEIMAEWWRQQRGSLGLLFCPSIHDFAHKCDLTSTHKILRDSTHLHRGLFSLLPSGTRLRSIRAKTVRFCNSLIPKLSDCSIHSGPPNIAILYYSQNHCV